MQTSNPIQEVNKVLFQRYLDKIEGKYSDEIIQRVEKLCYAGIHTDMLEDKQSRWLGFVQGVLATHGIISIVEERDFSRPLFHAAYDLMGLKRPETIEV